MNRIFLFFIAAIFSGSVLADWTQIGDDVVKELGVDTGRGVKTFVSKDSIDRIGQWAVMWTLRDYESPIMLGKKKQFSSQSLEEYDCKDMQHKTLSFYWYSKHQAKGDVVHSDTRPGQMQPIIPNSLAHASWKIACGK
jgi:hypothetical protein